MKRELELRPYQSQAVDAWTACHRRGIVAIATGGGKTRIAIAALRASAVPTAVLCPTRALALAWVNELRRWCDEPVGLVGDGKSTVERVTVLTFESAYRHMKKLGARFELLIVDEVHHFGSGARAEAILDCPATARLGLTATAPPPGSEAAERLRAMIGPIVFELGHRDLTGTYLAPLRHGRVAVALDAAERAEYDRLSMPFRELARQFFQMNRGADFVALSRQLARTPEGVRALRGRARAEALSSFPKGKRRRVRDLLELHRNDKTIVFTALADNAYQVAIDNLIPVITAETSTRERTDILARFQIGPLRAVATARVLNEGIDVPDARVAIIVSGMLGQREKVQRIGRVLRPQPGKEALVYELVTSDTSEARRAQRRSQDAARTTA